MKSSYLIKDRYNHIYRTVSNLIVVVNVILKENLMLKENIILRRNSNDQGN